MIDASAMGEVLVGQAPDAELEAGLRGVIHAPHLLDVEVASLLRGLVLGGKPTDERANEARGDYFDFVIDRHETEPLAERAWHLRHRHRHRHRHTAYDAVYVALAEALDAPLYTCDRKLVSEGHSARVRVFPPNVLSSSLKG